MRFGNWLILWLLLGREAESLSSIFMGDSTGFCFSLYRLVMTQRVCCSSPCVSLGFLLAGGSAYS